MIKIFKTDNKVVYIGTTAFGISEDFEVTQNGDEIDVFRPNSEVYEIRGLDYSQILDQSGSGFASALDAVNYLTTTFQNDTSIHSGDNISELVNDAPYLTDIVSKMPMVTAQCAAQNINDNGDLLFNASARSDTGWNHAANSNSFDFTGSPDRVVIEMQVSAQIDQAANIQRPAAVIALFRNGVLVAESKTGYIRDGNDHEETSYTIVYTDPAPGTDPVYTLTTRQESTTGGVVTSDLHSFITMTAILA